MYAPQGNMDPNLAGYVPPFGHLVHRPQDNKKPASVLVVEEWAGEQEGMRGGRREV